MDSLNTNLWTWTDVDVIAGLFGGCFHIVLSFVYSAIYNVGIYKIIVHAMDTWID